MGSNLERSLSMHKRASPMSSPKTETPFVFKKKEKIVEYHAKLDPSLERKPELEIALY